MFYICHKDNVFNCRILMWINLITAFKSCESNQHGMAYQNLTQNQINLICNIIQKNTIYFKFFFWLHGYKLFFIIIFLFFSHTPWIIIVRRLYFAVYVSNLLRMLRTWKFTVTQYLVVYSRKVLRFFNCILAAFGPLFCWKNSFLTKL